MHAFRLADDERLLVFVAHHLVCDGGSMRVLLTELDRAYRGELAGGPVDVVPSPGPAPARPGALDYWRTALAGLPELDLPTDRGRPVDPTFAADSVPLTIGPDLVAAAERLGRAERATLFMVLLAAYQFLLAEHSGQDDFAVGSPEAGRSGPGRHDAVGLLADMVVLRADLRGRPTFRDLVRRARDRCLAGFAHRGVAFEDLVAALAPGRNLDGALFSAGLVFHSETGSPTLAGVPLEPVAVARPGLRYDVDLHLWRERDRLRGSWDFRTEVFDPATAARMAERLPTLLARALAEPDRPVADLDTLTDTDRALLGTWGPGPAPDDPRLTLHALFAQQVARTPAAVAVRDPRRTLTYRELDERANQLAHHLRGRAVSAGDVVGVRLGRSVDLTVAMLGILKAGAAFLPLDPAYPAERTEFMLSDCAATAVVTAAELAALADHPVSAVDGPAVSPDAPAYVLYTSGSTGRPKGVLVTHDNAVTMVRWAVRRFTPAHLSRVLASTSVCFDVSVFELFAPLCAGGTVVIVDNALSLLADSPDVHGHHRRPLGGQGARRGRRPAAQRPGGGAGRRGRHRNAGRRPVRHRPRRRRRSISTARPRTPPTRPMPRCTRASSHRRSGPGGAHPGVRPGPRGCGRCRSARSASCTGRPRGEPRLPQPVRADRVALPRRPVRRGARRADVPHRRPGPLPRRRRPALPRPAGLPGQGARAADRARRDRDHAPAAPRRSATRWSRCTATAWSGTWSRGGRRASTWTTYGPTSAAPCR